MSMIEPDALYHVSNEQQLEHMCAISVRAETGPTPRFWKVWKWTTKTHLPVTKTDIGATISVFVAGRAAGAAPTGGILNSSGEHEGFYYFLSIAKAKDNV